MFIEELRKQFGNIENAMSALQVNESHCINTRRELTEFEVSEWKAAEVDYKTSLIAAISFLAEELEEVIRERKG